MRTLVLLRGAAGCGKSTWIKDNDLEKYTISADTIRLLYQSPITTIDGGKKISQRSDGKVWKLIFELLEQRMNNGEFTIIDATHSRTTLISRYKKLIKEYRYRCYVVDFSDVPLDTVLERNRTREGYKFVPEDAIKNMVARIKTQPNQGFVTVIKPTEFDKTFKTLREPTDLSEYEKVVVFGDIHGCNTPLQEYFTEKPFNDKYFYIFLGDYIDRGLESVETLRFMMTIMNKDNVLLLEGNHEKQLDNYIRNQPITSNNFVKTREELMCSDINNKELSKFYRKLCQLFYFKYNNDTFLCTHGGVPILPTSFTPTKEIIKGSGEYEQIAEVYETWGRVNGDKKIWQINGHRNVFLIPMDEHLDKQCFNLCDNIEYGGNLRILTISMNNDLIHFEPNYILNTNFKPREHDKPKPNRKDVNNVVALQTNVNVIEKDLGEGISSFNFSRNAFRKGIWNEQTVKARGLFVDVKENKVVARSYEKFFNLGQTDDSTLYAIKSQWKFPVKAYVKYNGFLGILSWDKVNDKLMVCSKSLNKGEHVGYIEETMYECWTKEVQDKIRNYLKTNDSSMIFEVINPNRDTHIIKYDESEMILLDIIKNDWKFSKLSYKELNKLSNDFGVECKVESLTFNDFSDLNSFITATKKLDAKYELEGFVFEDSNNRMVKIKIEYYNLWKKMRGVLSSLQKGKTINLSRLITADENYVTAYMKSLGDDIKEVKNIIELRDMYEKSLITE